MWENKKWAYDPEVCNALSNDIPCIEDCDKCPLTEYQLPNEIKRISENDRKAIVDLLCEYFKEEKEERLSGIFPLSDEDKVENRGFWYGMDEAEHIIKCVFGLSKWEDEE